MFIMLTTQDEIVTHVVGDYDVVDELMAQGGIEYTQDGRDIQILYASKETAKQALNVVASTR